MLRKVGFGCLIAVAAVIALLVVIGIIADATGNGSKAGTSKPATARPDRPVTTARKRPTPKPPPKARGPVTLLAISGNGDHTSQTFTAGNAWNLSWSYDCTAFGSRGNFIVDIHTSSDASVDYDDQGLNQVGMNGSGVEHYHAGGQLYVTVNSECSWRLTATG